MNSMTRNEEVVNKLVEALVQTNGHAFATGYLTTYLTRLIDKYVPMNETAELRIEMLGDACNVLLGGKK